MITQYITKIKALLEIVESREGDAMAKAGKKMARSIQSGGIIHLFGCGHSHMLVDEVYYRAGGLAPIQPIVHEPLMLHKGATDLSAIEQKNDYASQFMQDHLIEKGDLVFVISTSGRNPVPIDVAQIAKEKGAYVIVMTSTNYAENQPSRHKHGLYLYEVADLVLDNHTPIGDTLLEHEQVSVGFAPSSTVIGTTIINAVFAAAIAQMAENNFNPPIFLSGNIEGSEDHNQQLIKKYGDRVKL